MSDFHGNGFVPRSKIEEIKANLKRAKDEVDELSSREHEWRMHIPARKKSDSDVIIGDALRDLKDLLYGYELLSQDMLKALKLLDAEGVWTGMDDVLHDRIQQLVIDRDGYKKLYEECKGEIDKLHDKYAHEGGIPQVMTAEIATKWIALLNIPSMWDIFQTATTNVFYASFQKTLFPDDKAQLKMLGFDAVVSDERFNARYMLKWSPPRSDEL